MKLVKCIVRCSHVDAATDALKGLDVSGVTVTKVSGRGRGPQPREVWRGREFEVRYSPQMMIDVVVADCEVDGVVRSVIDAVHTGRRGDGRVFVIPIEEAYTIRTRAGGPD